MKTQIKGMSYAFLMWLRAGFVVLIINHRVACIVDVFNL
jgi:hypothetical protein